MVVNAMGRPSNPPVMTHQRANRHSSGEDSMMMRVTCCFAPPRGTAPLNSLVAHSVGPVARDRLQRRTAESLYIMSCHGTLVEYGLEPRCLYLFFFVNKIHFYVFPEIFK